MDPWSRSIAIFRQAEFETTDRETFRQEKCLGGLAGTTAAAAAVFTPAAALLAAAGRPTMRAAVGRFHGRVLGHEEREQGAGEGFELHGSRVEP